MKLLERVERGLEILKTGSPGAFANYVEKLKSEDPLGFAFLDFCAAVLGSRAPEAIKKGRRLLARVRGEPEMTGRIYGMLGLVYRQTGEMEVAENCYLKALDIAEHAEDRELWSFAKVNLLSLKFFRAEYDTLYMDIKGVLPTLTSSKSPRARYLLALLSIITGKPERALDMLRSLIKTEKDKRHLSALLEVKGFALRMLGDLGGAVKLYTKSALGYLEIGSAYSAFPCAKALEIARFAGLEPPPREMVDRCMDFAKKGGLGELAALREIEALLSEDKADLPHELLKAARDYLNAYQPVEAFVTGLSSAFLAWKHGGTVFHEAMRFLVPLAPSYRAMSRDPILGPFLEAIYPLLTYGVDQRRQSGIRAHLIGEMRIFVDRREVHLSEWRNKKSARAFVYLLLSPKHRLPYDHLFYLIWPRRKYNERSRELLYTAMVVARRNLGRPDLLIKKGDYYQLEDVWTDLGELENLMRLADATRDPAEKEELLARARELAKGELLPEFPYDRHIDEYRQYYNRLRKRLFGDAPLSPQ